MRAARAATAGFRSSAGSCARPFTGATFEQFLRASGRFGQRIGITAPPPTSESPTSRSLRAYCATCTPPCGSGREVRGAHSPRALLQGPHHGPRAGPADGRSYVPLARAPSFTPVGYKNASRARAAPRIARTWGYVSDAEPSSERSCGTICTPPPHGPPESHRALPGTLLPAGRGRASRAPQALADGLVFSPAAARRHRDPRVFGTTRLLKSLCTARLGCELSLDLDRAALDCSTRRDDVRISPVFRACSSHLHQLGRGASRVCEHDSAARSLPAGVRALTCSAVRLSPRFSADQHSLLAVRPEDLAPGKSAESEAPRSWSEVEKPDVDLASAPRHRQARPGPSQWDSARPCHSGPAFPAVRAFRLVFLFAPHLSCRTWPARDIDYPDAPLPDTVADPHRLRMSIAH